MDEAPKIGLTGIRLSEKIDRFYCKSAFPRLRQSPAGGRAAAAARA
jgi:hypothetical protein